MGGCVGGSREGVCCYLHMYMCLDLNVPIHYCVCSVCCLDNHS